VAHNVIFWKIVLVDVVGDVDLPSQDRQHHPKASYVGVVGRFFLDDLGPPVAALP
jgi:hypothetical protein